MMATIDNRYRYSPELPEPFKCRVPLEGSIQALVVNGRLGERVQLEGLTLSERDEERLELSVDCGAIIKETLQIICVRDGNTIEQSDSSHLQFGENSESELLLCYHTLSLDKFATDSSIYIDLKSRATVRIVVMQNEHNLSRHTLNLHIRQESFSAVNLVIVGLNGAFVKNNFTVNLNGEGAFCDLAGISLVDGNQEFVTTISMNHQSPNCHSSQLFKGILDDSSKVRFNGKITVFRDAQKTEAYQANHNLLLSEHSKAYAEPQLEIYADDVKCSHGATNGRLDENAIFYMRSRGIGLKEAKLLQQIAFAYSVLEKIGNRQLRERLQDLVESRLRGELSHCENCSLHCC